LINNPTYFAFGIFLQLNKIKSHIERIEKQKATDQGVANSQEQF